MVKLLQPPEVRAWLADHGLTDGDIVKVMEGIEVTSPMYLRTLEPGEKLVQYRYRPSAEHPSGDLGGRWFALPSVQPDDIGKVGIGHGASGRSRHELRVVRPVEALETTAKAMSGHPTAPYRGPGGATQIFLPDRGISSLG